MRGWMRVIYHTVYDGWRLEAAGFDIYSGDYEHDVLPYPIRTHCMRLLTVPPKSPKVLCGLRGG